MAVVVVVAVAVVLLLWRCLCCQTRSLVCLPACCSFALASASALTSAAGQPLHSAGWLAGWQIGAALPNQFVAPKHWRAQAADSFRRITKAAAAALGEEEEPEPEPESEAVMAPTGALMISTDSPIQIESIGGKWAKMAPSRTARRLCASSRPQ